MWLLDLLSGRLPLWRKITDQRLANQQGDLLRIEQKLDDADFRLHKTLGEQSGRLDDQAITIGQLARDIATERRHLDMTVRAADLISDAAKELRQRMEKLEQRADEADRQIVALVEWATQMGNAECKRRN